MRKLFLGLLAAGLLVTFFNYILPVNKYDHMGILGSGCDGPIHAIIFLSVGLSLTTIGVLIFLMHKDYRLKSKKVPYSIMTATVFFAALKIFEIYHENSKNILGCE